MNLTVTFTVRRHCSLKTSAVPKTFLVFTQKKEHVRKLPAGRLKRARVKGCPGKSCYRHIKCPVETKLALFPRVCKRMKRANLNDAMPKSVCKYNLGELNEKIYFNSGAIVRSLNV